MAYRTIRLSGDHVEREAVIAAGQTITPGHLVFLDSAGKLIVHASAGGRHINMFALEDDIQGNDIDDNYTVANKAKYGVFYPGSEVYAWVAGGENIAIGDFLESNGDGTLREVVVQDPDVSGTDIPTDRVVGVAMETVDNSASGATKARLIVMIK